MKQLMKLVFVLALILAFAGSSSATEGGGGAYPNGAEGLGAGMVPPPGTYFLNYFTFYTADDFRDQNGTSVVPGFKLRATADVLRFLHVTNKQVLGGNWGVQVFVPVVDLNVHVPGASQHKTNVGDIIVDPFVLSWHTPNWHIATGIDLYVPTGEYHRGDVASIGRHYWTFEPIIAATYLTNNGWEASAKIMYDINTKNSDTGYLSGQELHVDYGFGKKMDNFTLGVSGYYYKQISSDKQNGLKVNTDGNKGTVFGIGPEVKYDYKNMSFILKYQNEMGVKNRPDGDKLWFKFIWAL